MNEHVDCLLNRYKSRGVLVDANILLLHFVGSYDRSRLRQFKRTCDRYSAEDFDRLTWVLSRFDRVVTTPNILSEVSCLSPNWTEPARAQYFDTFAKGIADLSEHYVVSADVAKLSCFPSVGLTDAGIMQLAKGDYLVLTDDLELYGRLSNAGIDVLNFNHLRPISF
jgi:hypothetical protein